MADGRSTIIIKGRINTVLYLSLLIQNFQQLYSLKVLKLPIFVYVMMERSVNSFIILNLIHPIKLTQAINFADFLLINKLG